MEIKGLGAFSEFFFRGIGYKKKFYHGVKFFLHRIYMRLIFLWKICYNKSSKI